MKHSYNAVSVRCLNNFSDNDHLGVDTIEAAGCQLAT